MSDYSEEDGFAAALHQAVATLPAPDPGRLYDASLRRGRAIRRRRRAGTGVGAAFALSAAATLVFALPGAGPGRPASTTATASASGRPAPSAAASASASAVSSEASSSPSTPAGTDPSAGSASSGAVTSSQLLQTFEAMLPSTAVILPRGGDGGPSATNPSKDVVSGLWDAQVEVTLQSPGIGSYITFSLYAGAWARTCSQADSRTTGGSGSCTSTALAGGKLFTTVEAGTGGTNPIRYYVWLSQAGYTTELSITDQAVPDFQLTTAQIKTILTASTWSTLVSKLAG